MKIAVYPGSFDPVTNGHLDVVRRAANLFDRVYVAAIKNPEKAPYFDLKKRVKMLTESLTGIPRVKVASFDGLLVNYVKRVGACAIIRGLRAVSDFDFEFQMALTNRKMAPEVETIFMMTDYKYSYLSSSLVKQIARLGGNIEGLVPPPVAKILKRR